MTPNRVLLFWFSLIVILKLTSSINLVQLIINNNPTVLYNNGAYSSQFITSHTKFSCSLNSLFTYQQSPQNLQNNSPYQLSIKGVSSPISISISTEYGIISPMLNISVCNSDCTVDIRNFCPNPVSLFHYFDNVVLNIQGLQTFTYNVICNKTFGTSTFEAGEFIIVVACFLIIVFSALFNKAWAFQTKGFEITYGYIAFYVLMQAIGGTLIIVDPSIAQIVGDIAIWFIGSFGMIICANELLYKLRIQKLKKTLINIKKIGIRVTDVISFFIALAILLSWILNDKNWIISDIISLSVMIGAIKIFKITSFKKALTLYLIEVSLEILFVVLIDVLQKTSYEDFLLNDFNNPLEIQLPTINPVYGLKCSWLPVSVTIFPGILLSYFHRFDNSRNTKIYLITSSLAFFIGAIIWIVITSLSTISFPFQSITEPLMLTLVILFAYNRKQIKVLWNGKFYDPEFKNQEDHDEETYNYEMQAKKVQLNENLFDGLKIDKNQQDSEAESSENQPSQTHKEADIFGNMQIHKQNQTKEGI